ncbi:MAG: hypothetical protein WBM40_05060 [Thiohalocapsa sp.]
MIRFLIADRFTSGLAACVALTIVLAWPVGANAGDEEGHHSPFEGQPLLTLMHNMQYYGHKLGLAIDAGNRDLQGFYIHEVEEVIEAVSEIDSYDDIAISTLLESTLKPTFEALEAAIEIGDKDKISASYDNMLEGCNSCHKSANRPYIVIERNRDNPYPQSFAPKP